MPVRYKVMHGEKYQTADGEKTRWLRVGSILTTKKGGHILKMDAMPVVSEGWFQLFDPDDEKGAAPQTRKAKTAAEDFDDDIPF